jgi:hypothetical protein
MMAAGEGGLRPIPPRAIDGVSTDTGPKDAHYDPQGVLSHEFYPPTSVMITQLDSDLSYMATYWEVENIWRLFILNRDIYERARDKLLQSRTVVVDYTDMHNLGIYIPKNVYVSGIDELYKTMLDDLRQMDRENLDRHLTESRAGRNKIDDVLQSHYERIA